MKLLEFQQDIVGTAYFTKIIIKADKVCGNISSKYAFFDDILFRRIKPAEDANAEGLDYFGPAKTIHKGFCLATLEKKWKSLWEGLILLYRVPC